MADGRQEAKAAVDCVRHYVPLQILLARPFPSQPSEEDCRLLWWLCCGDVRWMQGDSLITAAPQTQETMEENQTL